MTAGVDEYVIAVAACQLVVVLTAVQRIIAVAPDQGIAARVAMQIVIATAAVD